MNTRTNPKALLAILLLGAIAFAGCAAVTKESGIERSEAATAAMQVVESDMKQASAQIDATNAALNDVITIGQSPAVPPDDVKNAFEDFSQKVATMEDTSKTLQLDIDKMNSEANDYFEAWSREGTSYTSPRIQKLSQEERVRLSQNFSNIASTSAGMRGHLNAYISEIKQIQSYLSNNLTAPGIAAIAPTAKAAERNGDNLKRSFQPVQTAIAQTRAEMTPGAAVGGGAGAGGTSTVPAAPQGTSPSPDTTQQQSR